MGLKLSGTGKKHSDLTSWDFEPNEKCLTCISYDKYNHLSFTNESCNECIHYALRTDRYIQKGTKEEI